MDDANIPLQGIRAGAVLRPEPLFHRRTRLIIDTHYNEEHNLLCNGLEEIDFQNLKLISLDKLFDNKHEIFLGFGKPNVYLTVPNEDGTSYVKFAAFIFWRQVSAVIDTKGRAQSGFMIRIRNYPEQLLGRVRQSMKDNANRRHVSCAYANACVLSSASITSGGGTLRSNFGARALFQRIFEHGLEFEGTPLTLDFIRTTPLTLEEHFHEVRKKEWSSLGRTYTKIINECHGAGDKNRAPIIEAHDVPIKPVVTNNVTCLTSIGNLSATHVRCAGEKNLRFSHSLQNHPEPRLCRHQRISSRHVASFSAEASGFLHSTEEVRSLLPTGGDHHQKTFGPALGRSWSIFRWTSRGDDEHSQQSGTSSLQYRCHWESYHRDAQQSAAQSQGGGLDPFETCPHLWLR